MRIVYSESVLIVEWYIDENCKKKFYCNVCNIFFLLADMNKTDYEQKLKDILLRDYVQLKFALNKFNFNKLLANFFIFLHFLLEQKVTRKVFKRIHDWLNFHQEYKNWKQTKKFSTLFLSWNKKSFMALWLNFDSRII